VNPGKLVTNFPIHILRTAVAVDVGRGGWIAVGRSVGVRVGNVSPADWAKLVGTNSDQGESKPTPPDKRTNMSISQRW